MKVAFSQYFPLGISLVLIFGQDTGRYKPPSLANPVNSASSKFNIGALPRVEIYFIIFYNSFFFKLSNI